MHVLYVSKLAPQLGARRIYETGKRLVELGHRVSVLSAITRVDQPEREYVEGIEVRAIRAAPDWVRRRGALGFYASRMPFYLLAPRIVEREYGDVDVVVEDVAPLWSAGLPEAASRLEVPLVYQIHNVYETAAGWIRAYGMKGLWGAHKERRLRASPACDAVYSDALWTAESLAPDVDVPVEWIPNGVDTDFFRPSPDAEAQNGPLRIANVGRLVKLKNHRTLLTAAARSGVDFRLRILGNGPLAAPLARMVEDLGIRDSVRIEPAAQRHEVLRAYREADLLCLPSLYEGMPLAALEAMACATPVAMSNIPAARGLVDERNGWRLPATDAEAWSDLIRTVADDRESAHSLGAAAREFVVQAFNWDRAVSEEVALFERVVAT